MITVVGCTGYIGSKLCLEFSNMGEKVVGLCLDKTNPLVNQLTQSNIPVFSCDITNLKSFKEAEDFINNNRIDTVYQMAGIHSSIEKMNDLYINGIMNLISLFNKKQAPYFVFASSGITDFSKSIVSEIYHPFEKIITKMEYCIKRNTTNSIIVRIAEVYGKGKMNPFEKIDSGISFLGDGQNLMSKIHIDDVIKIMTKIHKIKPIGTYELCDDLTVTQRDFYDYAEFLAKKKFITWNCNKNCNNSRLLTSIHGLRNLSIRMNNQYLKRILSCSLKYPNYKIGLNNLYFSKNSD